MCLRTQCTEESMTTSQELENRHSRLALPVPLMLGATSEWLQAVSLIKFGMGTQCTAY